MSYKPLFLFFLLITFFHNHKVKGKSTTLLSVEVRQTQIRHLKKDSCYIKIQSEDIRYDYWQDKINVDQFGETVPLKLYLKTNPLKRDSLKYKIEWFNNSGKLLSLEDEINVSSPGIYYVKVSKNNTVCRNSIQILESKLRSFSLGLQKTILLNDSSKIKIFPFRANHSILTAFYSCDDDDFFLNANAALELNRFIKYYSSGILQKEFIQLIPSFASAQHIGDSTSKTFSGIIIRRDSTFKRIISIEKFVDNQFQKYLKTAETSFKNDCSVRVIYKEDFRLADQELLSISKKLGCKNLNSEYKATREFWMCNYISNHFENNQTHLKLNPSKQLVNSFGYEDNLKFLNQFETPRSPKPTFSKPVKLPKGITESILSLGNISPEEGAYKLLTDLFLEVESESEIQNCDQLELLLTIVKGPINKGLSKWLEVKLKEGISKETIYDEYLTLKVGWDPERYNIWIQNIYDVITK